MGLAGMWLLCPAFRQGRRREPADGPQNKGAPEGRPETGNREAGDQFGSEQEEYGVDDERKQAEREDSDGQGEENHDGPEDGRGDAVDCGNQESNAKAPHRDARNDVGHQEDGQSI